MKCLGIIGLPKLKWHLLISYQKSMDKIYLQKLYSCLISIKTLAIKIIMFQAKSKDHAKVIQSIKNIELSISSSNRPIIELINIEVLISAYILIPTKALRRQLKPIQGRLTNYLSSISSPNDERQMALANMSLALIHHISGNQQAQYFYKAALEFDQTNPIVNLCLAHFLHQKKRQSEVIFYLENIDIGLAIHDEYQGHISDILRYKYLLVDLVQENFNQIHNKEIIKLALYPPALYFSVSFYEALIQYYPVRHINYLNLIFVLHFLGQQQDALRWFYVLQQRNPTQQNILTKMVETLLVFQSSKIIVFCKKVIKMYPNNEKVYQIMISELISNKLFDQAQTQTLRLSQVNKWNYFTFKFMGLIFAAKGKHTQAIQFYQYSLKDKRHENTYYLMGESHLLKQQISKAIQSFKMSYQIKPTSFIYCRLSRCYAIKEELINSINCLQNAVTLDYRLLQPFLLLGRHAEIDEKIRLQLNDFMSDLKRHNPNNLHIQFNVSIYYYISKQSYRPFYELILEYLKQDKDQYTELSTIVSFLLAEYKLYLQNFKGTQIIFSMIIAILARASGSTNLSHEIYLTLLRRYRDKELNFYEVFTEIYHDILIEVKRPQIFLQWMAIQILRYSSLNALQSHHKAFSYSNDYKGELFRMQFQRTMEQHIQNLGQIGDIIELHRLVKVDQTEEGPRKVINTFVDLVNFESTIIDLRRLIISLRAIQLNWLVCNENPTEDNINPYSIHTEILPTLRLIIDRVTGLSWIENKIYQCDSYKALQMLVQNSQITMINTVLLRYNIYEGCEDMTILLHVIVDLLCDFYQQEFHKNQTAKLIFNSFLPYVPSIPACHEEFASILISYKTNSFYKLEKLIYSLKFIFQEKPLMEIIQEQSQMENILDFDEGTNVESILLTRQDTQSESQSCEMQSQSFQFGVADRKQRSRKFSDSNASMISVEEHQKFLNQIQELQNENVLQAIQAPYQRWSQEYNLSNQFQEEPKQDQKSQSSSEQPSDMYEQQALETNSPQQANSQISNQQGRYGLNYSHHTNFQNKRLYAKFNRQLFRNTYYIIKYLSTNNDKQHIARHYINHVDIDNSPTFEAEVQLGDIVHTQFIEKSDQQRTLRWLWQLGGKHILQWVIDIALGIAELQELGIYHADLALRNTIKITRKKIVVFKIIDFDKAFKVVKTGEYDPAFNSLQQLFEFWLFFKFEGENSKAPFDQSTKIQTSSSGSSEKLTKNSYRESQIIQFTFRDAEQELLQEMITIKKLRPFSTKRLPDCLQKLRAYMPVSHRKQFSQLVKNLLTSFVARQSNQMKGGKMKVAHSIIEQIIRKLDEKDVKGLDLRQFAAKVKEIGRQILGEQR